MEPKHKFKLKFFKILPYILPVITLLFMASLLITYQNPSKQNFIGLAIFQSQDNYAIKGQLKLDKNQINNSCILNIIIKKKEEEQKENAEENAEEKYLIIDSVNLTNDFFDIIYSNDEWYYINLNETGIKNKLIIGNYTITALVYYNNLLLDESIEKISFK